PFPPSELRNDISPSVDEVFEKALAYNQADRYPKARDLGDALFNALSLTPAVEKGVEVKGIGLKEEKKAPSVDSSILIPSLK
ncbi:hypothetical protein ACNF5F_27320, partial [Escherichia coli]|uniref:hypothetical protein n=1 Tax=Escherichia coli TaxID=562 RepID=UPI003BA23A33